MLILQNNFTRLEKYNLISVSSEGKHDVKNQNCRSQKTCQLQKDCGVHSTLGGLSLQGLSSGSVIGFSVNPRTVQNIKKDLAKTHSENVCKQLQQVLNVSKYIILYCTILVGPLCNKNWLHGISSR